MLWIVFKLFATASIIVLVSEIAKRSDKLGALLAALPMVTILALIWMYIEGQGQEKLANHAYYTFWYVIPTYRCFCCFPIC
ncbi:4-amino-4-deoxy-L-arabinose transferase [Vibrio astriarenae]|nr:4-amino-4-deoxy-L-arabinose transferase [Vibrio sp. C7]